MTVDPGMLVDPREQFLESGPGVLGQIQRVPTPVTPAPVLAIALGISAGVVVTRQVVQHRLANASPKSAKEAKAAAEKVWGATKGVWKTTVLPAIVDAYKYGAGAVTIPQPELEKLAVIYAMDLGEYLNTTSVDAMVNGFSAQLNAGANPDVAWQRSTAGYGLDDRQTRRYITQLTEVSRNKYEPMAVPEGAQQALDKAVLERADRLGVNEAYKATQMGRNTVWSYMEKTGKITQGAKKRWITAHDELVCPVCAPLDKVEVPLSEPFVTNGMKIYAPGVHPNCRCEIVLINSIDIVKAMPGDPFDRDKNGRFASTEQRRAGNKIGTSAPAPLWSGQKAGIWNNSPVFNQSSIWSSSGPALLNLPTPVQPKQAPIAVEPENKIENKPKVKVKAKTKVKAKAKVKSEADNPIAAHTQPMMVPASMFIKNAHMNARNFYDRNAEGSFIYFDGGQDLQGVVADDPELVQLDAFAAEMSLIETIGTGDALISRLAGLDDMSTVSDEGSSRSADKRSIKFFVFDKGWNGEIDQDPQPYETGFARPVGWYKITRVDHRSAHPETNAYPQVVRDMIQEGSSKPGYGYVDFTAADQMTSGIVRIHLEPASQSEVDETRIIKRARLALRRK